MNEKLPLWRAIAGFAVLGSLLAVLIALAPVYLENYRLTRYVRALAEDSRAATVPDETLRSQVLDRAHALNLPVQPDEVHIDHAGGKLQMRMKYVITESLARYQLVDLHMEAKTSGP